MQQEDRQPAALTCRGDLACCFVLTLLALSSTGCEMRPGRTWLCLNFYLRVVEHLCTSCGGGSCCSNSRHYYPPVCTPGGTAALALGVMSRNVHGE